MTIAVIAFTPGFAPAESSRPAVRFNVRLAHRPTAEAVERALGGTFERLGRKGCQAVFSDFTDDAGRPLEEGLARLGKTGQSYLGLIIFYDGSHLSTCRRKNVMAVTSPGSRIVYICPEAFRAKYRLDPLAGEAVLIHEALHTLGLRENPPSSREITSQVIRRCRDGTS